MEWWDINSSKWIRREKVIRKNEEIKSVKKDRKKKTNKNTQERESDKNAWEEKIKIKKFIKKKSSNREWGEIMWLKKLRDRK